MISASFLGLELHSYLLTEVSLVCLLLLALLDHYLFLLHVWLVGAPLFYSAFQLGHLVHAFLQLLLSFMVLFHLALVKVILLLRLELVLFLLLECLHDLFSFESVQVDLVIPLLNQLVALLLQFLRTVSVALYLHSGYPAAPCC